MYLNPSTSEFIDLQFEDIFVERTEMLEALADMVNMPGSSKGGQATLLYCSRRKFLRCLIEEKKQRQQEYGILNTQGGDHEQTQC